MSCPLECTHLHFGVDAHPTIREPWWHDSVGYEIYIRSFCDGDGDGVGDLAGLTSRLDHLVELGVDLVWVTPFYASPMADFGYDVSDYRSVDPLFGSIEAFEHLVAAAHRRGIRLIVDLVPNHCSDQHRWFREAVADPDGPFRDYFVWRPAASNGGPPNNWVSHFGGPAWTFEPSSGEFYLHLFLPEQPDLNWRNPRVRAEFEEILRFWLERGVDGFRIDVAHALAKDLHLRDNVQIARFEWTAPRWTQWNAFEHLHDVRQPETLDIYRAWREIAEEYGAVLIGETYVLDEYQLADILPGDGLDIGFWFKPMFIEWDADQIRDVLRGPVEAVADPSMIGWVSSSHDDSRSATRFGGGETGRRRALAFSTMLFCLPGLPFLYQGEELGLVDGVIPADACADPVGADVQLSRDGYRTPMPWEPGPSFGFSDNANTWLPHGGRTDADTASVQMADLQSWYHRFRALIELRKTEPELRTTAVEWLEENGGLVGFRRGSLHVYLNAGADPVAMEADGPVLFATNGLGGMATPSSILDPGDATVIRSGR
jgi:alpha-glucosidase